MPRIKGHAVVDRRRGRGCMIDVLEARMRHSHHLRRVLAGRMILIGGRRSLFFVFVIVDAFAVKIFWSFVFMGRTEKFVSV
jgi:hypothetical protein